jgi:DNA-binding IscR family transcriptional regulator
LSRPPGEITIGEIIRALEGPIDLAECINSGDTFSCAKSAECATRGLWKEVSDSISNVIDNRSLQDLLIR